MAVTEFNADFCTSFLFFLCGFLKNMVSYLVCATVVGSNLMKNCSFDLKFCLLFTFDLCPLIKNEKKKKKKTGKDGKKSNGYCLQDEVIH